MPLKKEKKEKKKYKHRNNNPSEIVQLSLLTINPVIRPRDSSHMPALFLGASISSCGSVAWLRHVGLGRLT